MRLGPCLLQESRTLQGAHPKLADFCSAPLAGFYAAVDTLFDDPIVLVFPNGHPFENRETISWNDLSDQDLIVPARGTDNRLLIDEAMARARLPLFWSYEVRRSSTALGLVEAGTGLALLPRSAVVATPTSRFGYAPVLNPSIIRPVGILSRTGHNPTASEETFKKIIRTIAGKVST